MEKTSSKQLVYKIVKRIVDLILGLIGLVFLVPVALVVKVAYILNGDFHSIFFTQERVGKNGKFFKFYKFRTMVPNADEILEKLLKEDKKAAKEYKINKKLEHDPRITKAGDFLRRLSLDELPQVINILKGDMSVIGNRPYLPREIPDMGEFHDVIVSTKPGLTGYWQVNGRSNTTFLKRLQLEREYSNIANLWLDIKIFFMSLPAVLLCRGAE
jgi:undecaprenyl-phosphate galactose phosphotransferase